VNLLLQRFLSDADAYRASRTFEKLFRHDISGWALTGGIAIEVHWSHFQGEPATRVLNDIDFLVESFDSIPPSLADDFIFRHIHPSDPPGRTLLQCVDPETKVRVDVFRAYGGEMSRCGKISLPAGNVGLVSIEDLVARNARLALDLAVFTAVPAVHAADFLRLAELVDPERVEAVWRDHRKPQHPHTFTKARRLLQDLIATRTELLVTRNYSTDIRAVCSRCKETQVLRLSDPRVVISLLGYC
jgi:hypothetical protein